MKEMSRKDFLKTLAAFFLSLACLPLGKWFSFFKETDKKTLKEAKHYCETDYWAG